MHKLFLPTLAATQSNYADDVVDAMLKAGFHLVLSRPSIAPTWPLTDQKTDTFLTLRFFIGKVCFVPYNLHPLLYRPIPSYTVLYRPIPSYTLLYPPIPS